MLASLPPCKVTITESPAKACFWSSSTVIPIKEMKKYEILIKYT